MEVLFTEVDNAGYDIVLTKENKLVYIQLKAISKEESTTSVFSINRRLEEKPGGCVVLIEYTSNSLSYYYFKAQNLKEYKTAKHTKANAKGVKEKREGIVKVGKKKFEACDANDLIEKLFA